MAEPHQGTWEALKQRKAKAFLVYKLVAQKLNAVCGCVGCECAQLLGVPPSPYHLLVLPVHAQRALELKAPDVW